MTFIDPGEQVS